jgi:hypothetical protein
MTKLKAQVYKQEPGAVRPTGEVLEPGYYWVRVRPSQIDPSLPGIPYGSEVGPFKTWRQAERDYQKAADRPLREKTEKDQHRRRSLVLAAEDMLEALRATLRHVDDDMNNRKVTLWILREVVLKAIAKAEGKHDHDWHRDQYNIEVCAHCGEERGEER